MVPRERQSRPVRPVPVGAYERSPASSPWSVAPDLDRGHVSGIGEVGRASWPWYEPG
jgi:hypothetical protein